MTRWEARELDSEDGISHAFLGCLKHHVLKATAFEISLCCKQPRKGHDLQS